MAVINIANIAAHLVNYKTDFNSAFDTYIKERHDWQRVSFQSTSTAESNDYAGLMDIPVVTEWVGARTISNLDTTNYVLTNRDWQLAVEIDKNNFTDDTSGMMSQKVKMLPKGFGRDIQRQVFEAIRNGSVATSLCRDGQPFFDGAHPIGNGLTVSNESFGAAQPRWILYDSTMEMGGIIMQMRENPSSTTFGPDSEWAALQNTFLFMGQARYVIGYGMWQSMFYSDAAFTKANFWTAYEAMLAFENKDGTPLNPNPDTIIYNPVLTAEVRKVLLEEGLFIPAATVTDTAETSEARGVIKNFIPSQYLA